MRSRASNGRITAAPRRPAPPPSARRPATRFGSVTFCSSTRPEYNVRVFVRAPELWTYHDKGKAALIFFIDESGIWRNLVLLDGRELYRFAISGKRFYDAPD